MVGIRFGGGRDELLTFMQYLGVITPPYLITLFRPLDHLQTVGCIFEILTITNTEK